MYPWHWPATRRSAWPWPALRPPYGGASIRTLTHDCMRFASKPCGASKEYLVTNAPATTAPATDASARWEDNAEFWVRIIREHRDRYRTELTDQAVFAAAGSCQGLDVLDVGCGEGYMTREIARRGARQATGIDKSPALIAAARSGSAGQQGIRFGEADAAALPF